MFLSNEINDRPRATLDFGASAEETCSREPLLDDNSEDELCSIAAMGRDQPVLQ